jgi:hypothetical protein
VVLRRRIKNDVAITAKNAANKRGHKDANEQLVLALPHDELQDNAQVWEYPVLATNASYDIAAIGQLYGDRCDCENGFDELKNQFDQVDDRQGSCGHPARQGCCAAVAHARPLQDLVGLHLPAHRRSDGLAYSPQVLAAPG